MIPRNVLRKHIEALEQGRLMAIPELVEDLKRHQSLDFFDWAAWHKEAFRLLAEQKLIGEADRGTTIRLMTFLVRSDQYRPGTLSRAVRKGNFLAVLRRLEHFLS
ncbi:DUF6508 domain-containing protein [Desulfocurvibacter africanus]|uniref:Uncharacterized protein n=1 Tax=Desulfocurvibacter africanus subsp. africanus str. Walvis Bay TaxID=690850 RepID=F3YV91_DESAF|nr:DUF6508 domain-containing protein [Desulfocurvibacter africanus]EGJ48409.1 hypothetical protein Desaf_0044 [Desulfocurvibacter africanus subsp. africanus str. Walvis Bay]